MEEADVKAKKLRRLARELVDAMDADVIVEFPEEEPPDLLDELEQARPQVAQLFVQIDFCELVDRFDGDVVKASCALGDLKDLLA